MVVFDIPSDRVRRKAGEICKDYGLERIQWSAFEGPMTRNRREELWGRLLKLIEDAGDGGRLAMFPIGSREAEMAQRWSSGPTKRDDQGGGKGDDRAPSE